jgi:ribose transport system substrate-binding protein
MREFSRRSMLLGQMAAVVVGVQAPGHAQARRIIAFSVSAANTPFYTPMVNGAREAARAANLDLIVLDAQNNIAKQVSDIEDALQRGISALLLNAVDDGAIRLSQAVMARGLPVIALQRDLGEANQTAFVGTNNVVLGEQMIHWWARHTGDRESRVLILTGTPGAQSSEDRIRGFTRALPQYPRIRVLAQQTGYYDRARSIGVAENLLQRHADAEAILCLNDEMAMGALAAAKALDRRVAITGMDANPDAVRAVAAGELTMTIALPPFEIGRTGVQFAVARLRGEAVPKSQIMDVTFVTRENARGFQR